MSAIAPRPEQGLQLVTDYGDRGTWLRARHHGIGASESAALFDLSPSQSRFSLWAKKIGSEPVEDDPTEEEELLALEDPRAERMEWGHLLEGPIAAQYERRTGRKLWSFSDFCIAQHPRLACMLATLDRFVIEAPDRRRQALPEEGVLEIKNSGNVEAWRDGPPQYYLCQVQHQLAVTGRAYGTLVVLLGGNRLRWWDIERNELFITELEEQCAEFWEDVQHKRRPAVDGKKATIEALKKLHPLDNGNTVELEAEAAKWWQQLAEAKDAIKAAEKSKDEAEAKLREAIGDATFGKVPGGLTISLKTTANAGYTSVVAPYSYRTLREVKAPKAANAGAFHAGRRASARKAG